MEDILCCSRQAMLSSFPMKHKEETLWRTSLLSCHPSLYLLEHKTKKFSAQNLSTAWLARIQEVDSTYWNIFKICKTIDSDSRTTKHSTHRVTGKLHWRWFCIYEPYHLIPQNLISYASGKVAWKMILHIWAFWNIVSELDTVNDAKLCIWILKQWIWLCPSYS